MKYDLHIHSCLSPCANDDMTPANIMGMAHLEGLQLVAVTDHNSPYNLFACEALAKQYGISFIPGMEVCTQEEIHILCYFSSLLNCMNFYHSISPRLSTIKNKPEIYGNQLILDQHDNITNQEECLLIAACGFSALEITQMCHNWGGLAFYAHIDKESYSVISVLGAVPEEITIDGIELSREENRLAFLQKEHITPQTALLCNSDAHSLWQIGEKNQYLPANHPILELLK